MKKISKILAPIDFTEASLHALDDAIDLAAKLEASVVVMHAYEIPVMGLLPEGAIIASAEEAARVSSSAETSLRLAVESRTNRGVKLESVLREGPAWQEIDAVADEIAADLIVMGTHGRRGILRALLGNVVEKVVRTAHQPVLTIRPPAAV
jgi:nucleotide-binding universal stress UspA family protein